MSLYALGDRRPKTPPKDQYWIAPGAYIIGDVTIAEHVGIWFGAVLRGDNEPIVVGAGANIQEHCILHTDMGYPLSVGEHCTIGHRAILHGCQIGHTTLVGMGATILNGAVIGNNCLIGAGALVSEGKTIADNSLVVGMPARVIRPLRKNEVAALKTSAQHYQANFKRFAKELKALPD